MHLDAATRHGFLQGGGKLGELIAAFDWSGTSLGPIDGWCAAIRTTLSIILRSPLPMCTLWGPDGIMIYNEAYAGVAGARHPALLGSKVLEGWPEVADFNAVVLDVVLAGGTLEYKDQALTLNRNGAPEQLWFDLDYSPITDDSGAPIGVIAIVVETTEKVQAERWLAGESDRLRQMFQQAPSFIAMLRGPDHVFEMTNDAYLQLIGHRDIVGMPVLEALPEIAGQGFVELLDEVYASGKPYIGRGLKAFLQRTAGSPLEERFVDFIYQPVRDPGGEVVGIFVEGADVTEEVLATQAVRDSESKFRLFAEAMPNHVWAAPPNGLLDWFNSRIYEYSGVEPGALDGNNWASIVHPDDLPAAAAAWVGSVESGDPYEMEFRIRRHDGVYRWFLIRAECIRDEHGKVVRWIGTNTDIEDHRRTVRELAESQTRLQLAIEAGQLAVWDLDTVSRVITPSAALNRLFGFAEDASPDFEDYQSRYAPGETERLAQMGAEMQADGRSEFEAEAQLLWPDGSEHWVLIRAEAVDGGRRAIGVVIDITERVRTERRLKESERRFRLSQNAAGIASLELDIESGTVIGSDHFWEIWGLSQRDSIHISELENIVVPEHRNVRSTEETRRNGQAVPSVEYRIRRPDTGEVRWLSRHIEFVHDAAGKPVKMFGIMQDITDRKEAEGRQAMLTHELEHRIKNILAMVSAIASQTLRNGDLETAAAHFGERLRALSNAHDILTRTKWTAAALGEVVRSAITPLPAERIDITGPDVALGPKMALSLALAINELGTNALKYGALSGESGRVAIEWNVDRSGNQPQLTWRWTERGGPPVEAPARRGFGRFLIERVLAADFQGKVGIEYLPEGVEVILSAPEPTRPTPN